MVQNARGLYELVPLLHLRDNQRAVRTAFPGDRVPRCADRLAAPVILGSLRILRLSTVHALLSAVLPGGTTPTRRNYAYQEELRLTLRGAETRRRLVPLRLC